MALPYRTTGSLRPVALLTRLSAVKLLVFCTLNSMADRVGEPLCSSVTLWRRPPCQTTHHAMSLIQIMDLELQLCQVFQGWLHIRWRICFKASHLSCQTESSPMQSCSKGTGLFRLAAFKLHLHSYFNFTEFLVETVWPSLRHSCRSELTRQGISLP